MLIRNFKAGHELKIVNRTKLNQLYHTILREKLH